MPPCLAYWLQWGLLNFLPGLASNCDPPDLCLPSSWDNRNDSLIPASKLFFIPAVVSFLPVRIHAFCSIPFCEYTTYFSSLLLMDTWIVSSSSFLGYELWSCAHFSTRLLVSLHIHFCWVHNYE
jgi:hypothetical protein